MAQEAALKEVAYSKLRRLLARHEPFDCADVKLPVSALFLTVSFRESAPRLRGPAMILDIGDAGRPAKPQCPLIKVARYSAMRKAGAKDAGEADRSPASESSAALDGMPSAASGKAPGDDRSRSERDSD